MLRHTCNIQQATVMIEQDLDDPLPMDPNPIYDENGNDINPVTSPSQQQQQHVFVETQDGVGEGYDNVGGLGTDGQFIIQDDPDGWRSNATSPEVLWEEVGQAVANGEIDVLKAFSVLKAASDETPEFAASAADNNTPLHLASLMGMPAIVRLLVAEGADPAAKNDNGDTPSDVACEHADADSSSMAEILSILKAQDLESTLLTGSRPNPEAVDEWSVSEVLEWANEQGLDEKTVQKIHNQHIDGKKLASVDPEEDSGFEFALIELGLTQRVKLSSESKLRDRVGSLGDKDSPRNSYRLSSGSPEAPEPLLEEPENGDYLSIGDNSRSSSRAPSASPQQRQQQQQQGVAAAAAIAAGGGRGTREATAAARPATVRSVVIDKTAPPGGIGLGLVDLNGQCTVSGISPGGNADKTDVFRIGDVIVMVNNSRCEGEAHQDVIALLKEGDTTTIHLRAGKYPYEPPADTKDGGLARTNSYVIANAAAAAPGDGGDDNRASRQSVSPGRSSRSTSPSRSRLPIRQDSPNPPVAQMALSQRSSDLIADGSSPNNDDGDDENKNNIINDTGTPVVTPNVSPARSARPNVAGTVQTDQPAAANEAGACCAIL